MDKCPEGLNTSKYLSIYEPDYPTNHHQSFQQPLHRTPLSRPNYLREIFAFILFVFVFAL